MKIFTERDWNGWVEALDRNTIRASHTTRVRRTAQGQVLDFYPEGTEHQHPWIASMRWNGAEEIWEVHLRAGLVNGVDPVVVEDSGFGMEDSRGLAEEPWIPLRSFREGLDETGVARKFFEARGVRGDLSDQVQVNAIGGITILSLEDKNPLPPRRLMACDLYLAVARATFAAEVTVVDASGTSGQAVDYSVRYDTAQLDRVGVRPRLMQAGKFPEKQRPTLIDRLMGNYQDDGEDRLNVCTVYLLSPPNWEGPVDGSWTAYSRNDVFWNLRYGAPNVVPPKPPAPIRFFSGLGGGFGDMIINQYLALDNALADRLGNAVRATTPEGQWSVA